MANALTPHSGKLQKLDTQLDYILLDGSFSMQGERWNDGLRAIQTYVDGMKAGNVNTQIMLTTFCSIDKRCRQRDVNIRDWISLMDAPIGSHWGGTPLWDAIYLMGADLNTLDPPRAAITIVTDGGNTESSLADESQAKAVLDWCRAKGWQVTLIGADFNNSAIAKVLGMSEASAIGVSQKLLSDAAANLAKKRAKYGLYGTDMHFTGDEKQQFGGYLNAPEAK